MIASTRRQFGSGVTNAIHIVYALMAMAFIFQTLTSEIHPTLASLMLLGPSLVFAFLFYAPAWGRGSSWSWRLDCLLAVVGVLCLAYIARMQSTFYVTKWSLETYDYVAGAIVIVLLLEATRRATGIIIPLLVFLSLLFAHFGPYAPGALGHPSFDWAYILDYVAFSDDGVWGVPIRVVSRVVVLFMIFSSFLNVSGAGHFFVELPLALFGGVRGGPAKVAVVGSGLLGTLSGSVIVNVVTTGTFTIPMMKKIGYPPEVAGAVESIASTGGQIAPPVMGTAAFIIAEILGRPYWEVAVAAIVPALLYYVTLFVIVDCQAGKRGIRGLPREQLPSARRALAWGSPLLVPLLILIYLLGVARFPAQLASFWAIVSLVAASMLNRRTRLTVRKVYQGLYGAIPPLVEVAVLCGTIGIFIGMINMSGVGVNIGSLLVNISGGQLWALAIMTMALSLLMGMGLPTVACYLFVAPLLAPALAMGGVPKLAAHLFVFYGACLSAITPPTCFAAFAAAPIAGVSPMKIGWTTVKMAGICFAIPFLLILSPEIILQGEAGAIALVVGTAVFGTIFLVFASEGWLVMRESAIDRLLFLAGGVLLMLPGWRIDLLGVACVATGLLVHFRRVSSSERWRNRSSLTSQ